MGLYTIGVISRMLGVHQQTLREYERRGLIQPQRTRGKTRLYSEDDLADIRRIVRLTSEMGVNLAGVEIILEMRRRLADLAHERDRLTEFCLQMIERLDEFGELDLRKALVPSRRGGPLSRI